MKLTVPFILASSSPRRSQLLSSVGFSFSVIPADVDETEIPEENALSMVSRLSIRKATVISNTHPGSLVLGSDTSVEVDGQIIGKPRSNQEAHAMLRALSGKSHFVHTGIALAHKDSGRFSSLVETTTVEFAHLSDKEIEKYVASGTCMDKAGAYGIQDDGGAFFVRGISGDFYTVMGLPLHRLYTLLRSDFGDIIQA